MVRGKIIYLGGVFDLFHFGHLSILRRAKELGEVLVVGVLTDDGAAEYKRRPIIPYEQRFAIVKAIKYVNLAVGQPHRDPTPTLRQIRPDTLVHGDDWKEDSVEWGQTWMRKSGGRVVMLP